MELLDLSFVHDGERQAVCIETCMARLDDDAVTFLLNLYGDSFPFWFWQLGRGFFSI